MKKIAIVGSPNVGKSALFGKLTRRYVTVSNYPGTTVEVTRGRAIIEGEQFEVIDTPGMYSLLPITEEEKVARRILIRERPDRVIHVIEAKNIERMLPLTIQLIEAGLPTILVLNMMDEARAAGMEIDARRLEKIIGVPVVRTVCTRGEGIDALSHRINTDETSHVCTHKGPVEHSVEIALERIGRLLETGYGLSKRAIGILLLQEDSEIMDVVRNREPHVVPRIEEIVSEARGRFPHPIEYELAIERQREVNRIIRTVVREGEEKRTFGEMLSRLTMNPVTGLPILFLVLYFGLYKFVGSFGAGTVVDFLEGTVFEGHVNPFVTRIVSAVVPWPVLRELFTGEYGVITLGVRYAVALILPIVTFFFIVFSIIEDSGYLPRLAMLIDRAYKKIGLSGRAVIPMVLGFGCDTMATMVTRTLPTKRERVIATMLLSLAVPCSAQLGVILALLEGRPAAALVWASVICAVFLFIGYLSAKILPGERPSFYMEVPPLRFPRISNVAIKTFVRVKWYFREVMPLFILASVLIWAGQITGVFAVVTGILRRPVGWIGLPPEAAKIFFFGFFRRDYGAAGLYDLDKSGLLSGVQLVVACVALTLFLPCIAQFLINARERGWRTALGIGIFVLFFSFTVAFILNLALTGLGVAL